MPENRRYRLIETPAGPFALIEGPDGLEATWPDLERNALKGAAEDRTIQPVLARKLEKYFRGERVSFEGVATPVGPRFLRACWNACRRIPRGRTTTYADLARLAGSKASAARAAGQAMRRNRLPVIIPCHRVVGSSGSLHGYAGTTRSTSTGLRIKRMLLALEGAIEADS